RDCERVLPGWRLVGARRGRPTIEPDWPAERSGRSLGDADREGANAIGLGEIEVVARREAPRAIDEHADAEAVGLAQRDAFDAPTFHGYRLAAQAADAHVRVGRAELRSGIQRAVGEVPHPGFGSVAKA